jgi:hypothetical protein
MVESPSAYGTLPELVKDDSNHRCRDTDGMEYDHQTYGSIGEIRPADTKEYVINDCIGNSSVVSVHTTTAMTMFPTLLSLWKDLSGDHVPPAIPQWTNALKMVDRLPSHIKVPPGVGEGFWWPNPALFTHTESPVHQARYLIHYFSC